MEDISVLIDIVTKYRQLNEKYKATIDKANLAFADQQFITNFYNQIKEVTTVEKEIYALSFEDKDIQIQIISKLRSEINQNIALYTQSKQMLDAINMYRVCDYELYSEHTSDLNARISEINVRLIKLDNELSSFGLSQREINNMRADERDYKNDRTRHMAAYNEFKKKEEDHRNEIKPYLKNLFKDIYELSFSLNCAINNYFPIKDSNSNRTKRTGGNKKDESSPKPPKAPPKAESIFRTEKYVRFQTKLEKKLIKEGYIENEGLNLRWSYKCKNGKSGVQILVTFIVRLMDNHYFIERTDEDDIQLFFEDRYQIKLDQNFEVKKRKKFLENYATTFCEYEF